MIPSANKAQILVFADWYLPGYRAGGLVSALSNLIELVGDEFDFYVFTRDKDFNDACPHAGVSLEQWVSYGKVRALYTGNLSFRHLRRRILEVVPDLLYLNSFFSVLTVKVLCLRRLSWLPPIPVLLAPRGEFAPAALSIKPVRKRAYMFAALSLGLFRGVVWQASSPTEEKRIRTVVGSDGFVEIVGDIPDLSLFSVLQGARTRDKVPGVARFIFLSRISRNKNLDFALHVLSCARGQIEFEICGPVGDHGYWNECRSRLATMPGNVSVIYRGAVSRECVPAVLKDGHFLLLPTGGENFGYAILEAMAAGCPVAISDQTPWQDLEKHGVGWTLPLSEVGRWHEVLEQCVTMDSQTYAAMSARARQYAREWVLSTPFQEQHRCLFQHIVQGLPNTGNPEKKPLSTL